LQFGILGLWAEKPRAELLGLISERLLRMHTLLLADRV